MLLKPIVAAALGLLACYPIPAQQPLPAGPAAGIDRSWQHGPLNLRLQLSDRVAYVSDSVALTLRVMAPAGTEIDLPDPGQWGKEFQTFDVHRSGPRTEPDGLETWELQFRLEAMTSGALQLPELTVRYRQADSGDWLTAATEPVAIEFRSLVEGDPAEARPRPNPGPLEWPAGWWWLFICFVIGLSAMALVVWLSLRKRGRAVPAAVRLSPWERALAEMRRIEAAGHIERGEVDEFYTALSSVIRHYIEEQFGLRAPEQTTEEFLRELAGRPVFVTDQRNDLAAFLERCDLVKFAKVRPAADEGVAALQAARKFVQATHNESLQFELPVRR